MPVLTGVAGPNGSGKSTFTRTLKIQERQELFDPDAISKRLNPENPRGAAMAAGRGVLLRIENCLESGIGFAMEMTLASRKTLEMMRRAKARGFGVNPVYICLSTPELNIRRVHERVLQGGHDVRDSDVRRRYERSLGNLPVAVNNDSG